MTRDAHDGGDSPRKTTKGPKSGFKDKNCIKFKQFGSSGSSRIRIRASRIRDSDPDLNPDPGLLDGISPGNGSVSGRWIRPGLRDSTNVVAGLSQLPWPIHIIKIKIGHYYDRER